MRLSVQWAGFNQCCGARRSRRFSFEKEGTVEILWRIFRLNTEAD